VAKCSAPISLDFVWRSIKKIKKLVWYLWYSLILMASRYAPNAFPGTVVEMVLLSARLLSGIDYQLPLLLLQFKLPCIGKRRLNMSLRQSVLSTVYLSRTQYFTSQHKSPQRMLIDKYWSLLFPTKLLSMSIKLSQHRIMIWVWLC